MTQGIVPGFLIRVTCNTLLVALTYRFLVRLIMRLRDTTPTSTIHQVCRSFNSVPSKPVITTLLPCTWYAITKKRNLGAYPPLRKSKLACLTYLGHNVTT